MNINIEKSNNSEIRKPSLSLKNIIKIIISISLIAWLISRMDISKIFLVLKQIDLRLYFLALLLGLNAIVIMSYRCKYICKTKMNVEVPLSKCHLYYFYSSFYSNFLPTAIGGDIFRIYHLNYHINDISNSSSVVLFERISGFFSLILISFFASIILYFKFNMHEFLYQIFLIMSIFIFCMFLILNKQFESKAIKLLRKFGFISVINFIQNLNNNIRIFIEDRVVAKNIFFYSMSYQLSTVVIAYIYGSSLGINAPMLFYFVMIPITYFVTMIPISFAGIGLREVTIVSLFALVGVQNHVAITLSFLLYLEILLKGLVGGVFLLINSAGGSKKTNCDM